MSILVKIFSLEPINDQKINDHFLTDNLHLQKQYTLK